jgi:branched-chain amino acid transport system substrate-binding protein
MRLKSAGVALALFGVCTAVGLSAGAKDGDPGVSDTEIVIGGTAPYSGPASAYGVVHKSALAYFNQINDEGGINGRKVKFLSVDDGYSPPRTVEQTRRLVESDNVFLTFLPIGTGTSLAVRKYLNGRKIPQLFVMSGAATFTDYKNNPWSMAGLPTFITEGAVFGSYVRQNFASAKVGVLYQNDDFGKEYVTGVREGLRDKAASMLVKLQSYETTDPTIDSQLIALKAAGVDTLILATTPKFGAQAIRQARNIDWRPRFLVSYASSSVSQVMQPAGAEPGVITSLSHRDPTDPSQQDHPGYKAWVAFMDKYYPGGRKDDLLSVVGYNNAMGLAHILRQSGKAVTRENVMRQAASLDVQLPMMVDGVRLKTSPTDYVIMPSLRLARYDGAVFRAFGDIITVTNEK